MILTNCILPIENWSNSSPSTFVKITILNVTGAYVGNIMGCGFIEFMKQISIGLHFNLCRKLTFSAHFFFLFFLFTSFFNLLLVMSSKDSDRVLYIYIGLSGCIIVCNQIINLTILSICHIYIYIFSYKVHRKRNIHFQSFLFLLFYYPH